MPKLSVLPKEEDILYKSRPSYGYHEIEQQHDITPPPLTLTEWINDTDKLWIAVIQDHVPESPLLSISLGELGLPSVPELIGLKYRNMIYVSELMIVLISFNLIENDGVKCIHTTSRTRYSYYYTQ